MDTKHTPGPFTLGGETDFYDDMLLLPIEARNEAGLVHEIALVHTEADREKGEANARLFCAAPAMLEALKATESLLVDSFVAISERFGILSDTVDKFYKVKEQARAAIALAEKGE